MPKGSANSSLHVFANDLSSQVKGNSNAPPRSIRASDLDGNFKALTIVPSSNIPYKVNHSADGTSLDIFPAAPGAGMFLLGIVDGDLQWLSQDNVVSSPMGGF